MMKLLSNKYLLQTLPPLAEERRAQEAASGDKCSRGGHKVGRRKQLARRSRAARAVAGGRMRWRHHRLFLLLLLFARKRAVDVDDAPQ